MQPQFVGCMDVSDTGGCLHTDITTSAMRRDAVHAVAYDPLLRGADGAILIGVSG